MAAELHVIAPEPSASRVIEELEMPLERAREGTVSAVCLSWVNRDGSIENSWTGSVNGPPLLAAVARGMHRIAASFGE